MQCAKDKNDAAAYLNYPKSASKGNTRAHTNLGLFFHQGLGGVAKNCEKALEHYIISAEKGHVRAMYNAANMLEYGDGVEKNWNKALFWYRKAAESNDIESQKKVTSLSMKIRNCQDDVPGELRKLN